MKLFNLAGVALLTALPLNTAVDKGDQKWEIELNTAEEQFNIMIDYFTQQYVDYVTDSSITSDFQRLSDYLTNNRGYDFQQEITDSFNALYTGTEEENLAALTNDVRDYYFAASGFTIEDLTIVYAGTSLDSEGYAVANYNEPATITVDSPLQEIDEILINSTLLHSTSNLEIGVEWGDPLLLFEEGSRIRPHDDILVNYLNSITTSDITGDSYYIDENLYNVFGPTSYDKHFWGITLDVADNRSGYKWNLYNVTGLGIVPVTGSSFIGWILFMVPMVALFGPLAVKKLNDHNMKALVKKGGK